MKTVALIPARGGSKGVPGKNIAPILGKPLISYSIEAALECESINSVWVSSDAQNILDVARGYDEVNIHKRSNELASDSSPITGTIDQIFDLNPNADFLILLQPTSPLRTAEQLSEAIDLLQKSEQENSLISVCAMDDLHPARMYWIKENSLDPILPEFETTRRQEIPHAYYRNGSIYIVKRQGFKKSGKIMCPPSIPYVMPTSQLLNIDEPRDLLIAEPLMEAWLNGEL